MVGGNAQNVGEVELVAFERCDQKVNVSAGTTLHSTKRCAAARPCTW